MSPPPQKLARTDPVPSETPLPSPLLRHWHEVKTALFPFLTTSDCIALLGTNCALSEDEEVVERVSEAVHTRTQCLFQGCVADWCSEEPEVDFVEFHYYDKELGLPEHGHEEYPSFEETLCAWDEELGSRERSISLLSLAWLMTSELRPLLYTSVTPNVTIYTVMPFILPLSRLEEIQEEHEGHVPASVMGFHIDNVALSANGRDAQCAFCEALQAVDRDAQEHRKRYDAEPAAFEQKLRDEGLNSESEEFRQRMDTFHETRAELDEQYEQDYIDESRGTIAAERSREGRLPPLVLVDYEGDERELDDAGHESFYAPGHDGYCESKLRPLVAFFQRNGFGPVHRATLESEVYEAYLGSTIGYAIRRVEMVGAEAPHGFFAGVYFIERYT